MTALPTPQHAHTVPERRPRLELVDLVEAAHTYAQARRAPATWHAYRSDWNDFTTWCAHHHLSPLPADPDTVAAYLTDLAARLHTSTLQRRLSAISVMHREAGHAPPRSERLRMVWTGIRRTNGTANHGKNPLLIHDLRRVVDAITTDRPIDRRDRAILLVGFALGARRSELVALDVDDLELGPDGYTITIRRSKTDQEAAGRRVGVPYGTDPRTCPVNALRAWLELLDLDSPRIKIPVFRAIDQAGQVTSRRLQPRGVADAVKRRASMVGLDPADFAGHSLRSGLATSAAAAGASERAIMRQTGHRSVTVLRRYIRDGQLFTTNAASTAGL
jgi:site-specific recombinase XerD